MTGLFKQRLEFFMSKEDVEKRASLPLVSRSLLSVLCWICCGIVPVMADEVILERSKSEPQIVGDFTLSTPTSPNLHSVRLHCVGCEEDQTGVYSISAGELWTFFKEQGIESTDRLTLLIDVDRSRIVSDPRLHSVNIRLQDQNRIVDLASLGENNHFVIKSSDVIRFKPEAQLEIGLGFDFMERFSADSQERIILTSNVQGLVDPESARITIQGKRRAYNLPNIFSLVAFVIFWGILFLMLRRSTRKKENSPPASTTKETYHPEFFTESLRQETSSVA